MTKTYLFYDLETTGLNKSFDQVLQFAAIRTTLDLQEISRHQLQVKLNPDTIPAPGAILTHQIPIAQLKKGLTEYQAIDQIHQLLNQANTISLGYNTLSFDDEFLRFSFFRNLLPVYTHQYAQGCSRMDIYPMLIMYYLFAPEIIKWPKINGKISLKLENLNACNQWTTGPAHDALVDVEMTIALTKCLMQDSNMWQYLCGYFNKATDLARQQKLTTILETAHHAYLGAIMVSGKFGAKNAYQTAVLYLGRHQHYHNQGVWLPLDQIAFSQIAKDHFVETTHTIYKKLAEPGFILPFTDRYCQHLSTKRKDLIQENLTWLNQHESLFSALIEYHCHYTYPLIANADVQSSLYLRGFLNNDEQSFCHKFHKIDLPDKITLVEQSRYHDLRELAIRVLGRNFTNSMTGEICQEFSLFLSKIAKNESLVDYKNQPKLTPKQALVDINQLITPELDDKRKQLLLELQDYLKQQFNC